MHVAHLGEEQVLALRHPVDYIFERYRGRLSRLGLRRSLDRGRRNGPRRWR
jgi:hypothetical protein